MRAVATLRGVSGIGQWIYTTKKALLGALHCTLWLHIRLLVKEIFGVRIRSDNVSSSACKVAEQK